MIRNALFHEGVRLYEIKILGILPNIVYIICFLSYDYTNCEILPTLFSHSPAKSSPSDASHRCGLLAGVSLQEFQSMINLNFGELLRSAVHVVGIL